MPPEFFLDRGLGRRLAEELTDLGWIVHRAAAHFPDDAQHVADEDWLDYGMARGWSPLCKDGGSKVVTRNAHRWRRTAGFFSISTTNASGSTTWWLDSSSIGKRSTGP